MDRTVTVRSSVRGLLERSAAYQSLPAARQRTIAQNMTTVSGFLAGGATDQVDFPSFVAGLIEGVFQAIVDGSIEQMGAYADLIDGVAKAVQTFTADDDHRRKAAQMLSEGINRVRASSRRIRPRRPPVRSTNRSRR